MVEVVDVGNLGVFIFFFVVGRVVMWEFFYLVRSFLVSFKFKESRVGCVLAEVVLGSDGLVINFN